MNRTNPWSWLAHQIRRVYARRPRGRYMRVLTVLTAAVLTAAVLTAALVLTAAFSLLRLPDPLFDDALSTLLVDRREQLLGARIAGDGQWRFPPSKVVPARFRTALLEFEDRRFELHPGVDPLAVARAMLSNFRQGRVVSGASTITMQVIRLARKNRDRTLSEKLVEAVLALRLERRHEKDEIIALWASHAPFGGNVVGLETASWRYFGRDPQRLTWAETAMLAVLPNSPTIIHPGRRRDRLRAKRNRLLARLSQRGHLSSSELQLAFAEPLPEAPRPLPREADHLLDTLRARHGTQRFESTLDQRIQRTATSLVQHHSRALSLTGVRNAAALVLDIETMEVLAWVGNSAPGNRAAGSSITEASSEHGHAVDVVVRPRSTGSLLKPFLYGAMLQAGTISPTTLVPDVPSRFGTWAPENFDRAHRGAIPARAALARSLNIPAVHMLRQFGIGPFYHLLRRMGLSTLNRPAEHYGLALVLGGAEGTLLEMTTAYANLARAAGRSGASGQQRARWLAAQAPIETGPFALDAGAAWLTLEALFEVNRPGIRGAWRSFADARRIAWKTGTSWGHRDAWAIGVSGRHAVGIWVGNASGDGRPGLTGLSAAAPLLFDIFELLGGDQSPERMAAPPGSLKRVRVCRQSGFLAGPHCELDTVRMPRRAEFVRPCPYHQLVHLDQQGHRVNGNCEPVSQMVHEARFVLPPAEEREYRRHHPEYRSLPPWRADCAAPSEGSSQRQNPFTVVYPARGTRLLVPTDLGEVRSRAIFEAVHRDPGAVLHWHLDDRYLGATEVFHQIPVDPSPGPHRLTVVDGDGHLVERRFEILDRQGQSRG